MNNQHQYRPLTPSEAAKLLGVANQETFNRKFLEKTGMRISELPQGKIPFEPFILIGTHFAKNYPLAADAIGRYASAADDMSGRHRTIADGIGRKSDEERTPSDEIGRQADDMSGRQADGSGRKSDDERIKSDDTGRQSDDKRTKSDERTPSDGIAQLVKTIDNQRIAAQEFQNRITELEQKNQRADATSGRQADDISRLKQLLADERTEIGHLKRLLADEQASGRADEIEKQFTYRLEKAKGEWEKQERIRRADERTKSDEALFALRFQGVQLLLTGLISSAGIFKRLFLLRKL